MTVHGLFSIGFQAAAPLGLSWDRPRRRRRTNIPQHVTVHGLFSIGFQAAAPLGLSWDRPRRRWRTDIPQHVTVHGLFSIGFQAAAPLGLSWDRPRRRRRTNIPEYVRVGAFCQNQKSRADDPAFSCLLLVGSSCRGEGCYPNRASISSWLLSSSCFSFLLLKSRSASMASTSSCCTPSPACWGP